MSMEEAGRFLALLNGGDEEAAQVVGESGARGGVQEGADLVARAAAAAGWDFTALELRDAVMEARAVDDEELAAVSGGASKLFEYGQCAKDYYEEACTDTVEKDSWCWRGDECSWNSSSYHCTAAEKSPIVDITSD